MPNCDGANATERIRELEAQAAFMGRKPAVIFMVTGQDSPSDRHRSNEAGADGFYVKPVGIKALDAAIAKYFKNFKSGARPVSRSGSRSPRAGRKTSINGLNGVDERGINGGSPTSHKRRTVA